MKHATFASALFAAVLVACGSPTEPNVVAGPVTEAALIGQWSGQMPDTPSSPHIAGEDWSAVVMTIDNNAGVLHGQLAPRKGAVRELRFWLVNDRPSVSIDGIETSDNRCFSLSFVITSAEYRAGRSIALSTDFSGKCPNTVFDTRVRFTRM